MADGAILRLRRYGQPEAPRLVLSHGNGLAINGYYPFWGPLCERYDVFLFDVRNHGVNPPHDPSAHLWPTFVSDTEAIWQAIRAEYGDKPVTGVFHSLSAVTAVKHAVERPGRWRALVLFDPPIYPRDGHRLQPLQKSHMAVMGRRARRRMEHFDTPSQLSRQYVQHPAFRRWVKEAPALIAEATLRPDEANGGWRLACPRDLEALMFETNIDPTIWPSLATLDIPIKLICADPDAADAQMPSIIGRAMAAELPVEYDAIPDTTHFLQIEAPERCLQALEAFLSKHRIIL